jgi:4,5-dihydroxyphthalate decarboxylase
MRGFRQRCFFVQRDSPLREIAELRGKRVGINEWPATGNTWARALVRDQGVPIDSVFWLVGQVAEGYKPVPDDRLPAGVEYAPRSRLLVDMLGCGEIDALLCPWPPEVFYAPNSAVRRLYPDFPSVEKAYFQRTGIYPGHHIVVLRRDLVEAYPEVVGALYTAFDEARRTAEHNLRAMAEILPWLLFELEEDTRLIGRELNPYGQAPNQGMIEAFCEELFAQALVRERVDPDLPFAEFAAVTRSGAGAR